MSSLVIQGISKSYATQLVIDRLDLQIDAGEFVSLLGPSGCGKTTLLRVIAGLTHGDRGSVILDGQDITTLAPHKRNVGVVFQNYALFPHLNVFENIAFGLKAKHLDADTIQAQVKQALLSVQMSPYSNRSIAELSGGQQQRVAVARALAIKPKLVLLDEPLSALDRKLRETMQIELKHILRDAGMTAIFVTHDQEEALVMSDRIAVMNKGHIEQLDAPSRVYTKPASEFVLNFVGLSAQWQGHVASIEGASMLIQTPEGLLRCPFEEHFEAGATVVVSVRPERIDLKPVSEQNTVRAQNQTHSSTDLSYNRLQATVQDVVYRGSNTICYFKTVQEHAALVMVELSANVSLMPKIGERVELSWAVQDTLAYLAQPAA